MFEEPQMNQFLTNYICTKLESLQALGCIQYAEYAPFVNCICYSLPKEVNIFNYIYIYLKVKSLWISTYKYNIFPSGSHPTFNNLIVYACFLNDFNTKNIFQD